MMKPEDAGEGNMGETVVQQGDKPRLVGMAQTLLKKVEWLQT